MAATEFDSSGHRGERSLPFYFDFISPYAYLGWKLLRRWQTEGRLQVEPRPVLFAGLLNAHGTLGPAEVPAKRRYVFLDVRRKAERLGIEIGRPAAHPFNPLTPLRLMLAAEPQVRARVVDVFFDAIWQQQLDLQDEPALRRTLNEALGDADSACWEAAASPAVKQRLREETEQAVARGIFGVPTIDFDGELFWGVDSLDDLERALHRGALLLEGDWDDLPEQAVRRAPR